MDIMSGAFSVGSHVVIHADGDDAAERSPPCVELFEGKSARSRSMEPKRRRVCSWRMRPSSAPPS